LENNAVSGSKAQKMKYFVNISLIALLFAGAISCSKSNGNPQITGKWKILNDSTSFTGAAGAQSYYTNYIGKEGDYYDFRTDGKMYVKESASLDTMAYEIYSGNQVRCSPSPGFTTNYNTTVLTLTHATFQISGYTAEGQLFKKINLER
jgi:hypothetical protein